MKRNHELIIVSVAAIVGAYLRFANLGLAPFWCDEAYYATDVYHFETPQEFIPAALGHILGIDNELSARIPFAIAGTLTIVAVYAIRPSPYSALLSVFAATFPLFVFYDRMCRPYAMAALFIVLAWRWRWFAYAAILTTPAAILGIDVTRMWKQKAFHVFLICATVITLFIRRDIGTPGQLSFGMFMNNARFWYVPIIALAMYLAYYLAPKRVSIKYFAVVLGLVSLVSLNESTGIKDFTTGPPIKTWYSPFLLYSNWRGICPVDLATNFEQITRYYTGKASPILRQYERTRIDSVRRAKDTVLVGVDRNANTLSRWFFPEEVIDPYREFLLNGGVIVFRLVKQSGLMYSYEIVQIQP